MLDVYNGSEFRKGTDNSYRSSRGVHGGPLFSYIGNCKELEDLKAFMLELHDFWEKYSKCNRFVSFC